MGLTDRCTVPKLNHTNTAAADRCTNTHTHKHLFLTLPIAFRKCNPSYFLICLSPSEKYKTIQMANNILPNKVKDFSETICVCQMCGQAWKLNYSHVSQCQTYPPSFILVSWFLLGATILVDDVCTLTAYKSHSVKVLQWLKLAVQSSLFVKYWTTYQGWFKTFSDI